MRSPAVTVSVEVVVAGSGENEPFVPSEKPDAESVTGLEKPPVRVIVTVNVVEPNREMLPEDGLTDRVKSGFALAAWTDSETVVVWVVPPPLPEIVSV